MRRKLYSVNIPESRRNVPFPETGQWGMLKDCPVKLDVTLHDITMWFENKLATASFKRGRNLGLNGYVQQIIYLSDSNITFFKANVSAEMKKKQTYLCKIVFDEKSDVMQANCECPAGTGWVAACKHISATINVIEHFMQTG